MSALPTGSQARARAIRKRSDAARRGWETRRAHIEQTLNTVAELAEYARTTAKGLREWWHYYNGPGDGKAMGIHAVHAANRLDKLAEQLSSSKRTKGKRTN